VTAPVAEIAILDEIARASFTEGGFSVEEELTRPWSRIWIAHDEGRVAGFLIAWHVADEVHVLNVATAPALRRRGVATALMLEALAYAATSHVRIVLLEVRRSNRPAILLYRRLGFTAMGIRPNYYSDDGEDAVEMVLGLDPETGRALPGRDEVRLDC
jgi:ribosomal-protein-alanine N-acetyltransferase